MAIAETFLHRPKNPETPLFYRREEGRLHTAGLIPLAEIDDQLFVLIIKEQRTDPRFLKICGSCSFPVGQFNKERDGPIEEGGARWTAINEAWAEAGIQVAPSDLVYLGRFPVPNETENPRFEKETTAFVLTDQGLPEFGQEIWLSRRISLEEARRFCPKPGQKLMYVEYDAVADIFVTKVNPEDLQDIPFTDGNDLADTTNPHFVPAEWLTSAYQNTHPHLPQRVSLYGAMRLAKLGEATGGQVLYLPEDYSPNGILRPWVPSVIDSLVTKLLQIQSQLGLKLDRRPQSFSPQSPLNISRR